ncbi:ribonuclease HII [Aliihoeflea sp. PC F10.4]
MARQRSDSPLLFNLPVRPDFRMERAAQREGLWPVCGTDEAGRGPLAGPVVAAAVILDPKRIPKGLDDSKRMGHAEREVVFDDILKKALAVSVASVSAHSIDRSDIRKASLEAMCHSVKLLCVEPRLVLADGRDIPPGLTCDGKAVVKGDQRSQSIAAASIIAKVTRDRMMTRTASIHVSYGFDVHMGYATVRHRTAIEAHGPLTRLHRLSFAPFRLDAAE